MKILLINSLDSRYGSTYRFRKIADFFKEGFDAVYAESNCEKKAGQISVKQTDGIIGYTMATFKRTFLALRNDYDLLFVQKFLPFTLPCILIARLRKKKVVVDWDDLDSDLQSNFIRKAVVGLCEKLGPRFAHLITTHSKELAKIAGSRAKKAEVRIVNQGVDFNLYDPSKYKKNPLRDRYELKNKKLLGYMCTFTEGGIRDLDIVADAVGRVYLKEQNVALTLIGGGPEEKRVSALIDRYGIEQITIYTGLLDQKSVAEVLSGLDLSLVYMRDNPGNRARVSFKVMESLAMNLKIIGKLVGETKTLFGNYIEQIDGGAQEMAEGIMRSMENRNKSLKLRDKIRKNFEWENIKVEFLKYFTGKFGNE